MRQNSPLFRGFVVCLFTVIFGIAGYAQETRTTEGSLHLLDGDLKETGLCPLKRTDVRADISGFVSRVTVTQTFQNPLNNAIEAIYTFPLPNDAAVDDMTIQIGERLVRGRILERQRAKETYEKAKAEGKMAALLEQQRPNVFTQFVANITPNAEIKVMISYVETLRYADDTYEFTFPMTIGKRYMPLDTEPDDAARISTPSETRPGHTIALEINVDSGVPVTAFESTTHEIETLPFSASKFTVRLKDGDVVPNHDFVFRYKTAGYRIEDAVLTHHDERGGFFTLILQPPDKVMPADTTPKEIVFVLDTSGSMSGFPIDKAKEAIGLTLDHLNPSDTFNLITFAGDTHILFNGPVPATPENLEKARTFLSGARSSGGTEMMKAIRTALDPSDAQDHVRIVCFMTDGEVGNDKDIIREVQKHINARVFAFGIGTSINHYLLDEISREGRGEVEYVMQNDDGSKAAQRFFERVRNPLLTDISIEYKGLAVSEIYPQKIPDLFDAKPVIVTGRYLQAGTGKIILRGRTQGQIFSREIDVELPSEKSENIALASLWARRKIADLTHQDVTEKNEAITRAITRLGLDYHLLTSFTSMVAVDETPVTDGTPPQKINVAEGKQEEVGFVENYWIRRGPEVTAGANSNPPPAPPGYPNYGTNETVEITSSGDGLSQNSTSISTNVTSQELLSLPLNGRSFQSLITLAPGTQVNSGGGNFRGEFSRTIVNGQSVNSNQFTVDGVDVNGGVSPGRTSPSGGVGTLPQLTAAGSTNSIIAMDATQEISIHTFASASEGRTSGGTFNVITKSGTNSDHGSLFETLGNEALNAADPFARARGFGRGGSHLNIFGGTFGGPFVKDKAFFFGNYEGMRLRQAAFSTSEVPTAGSRLAASPGLRAIFDAFPRPNGSATGNGFAEFSSVFADPGAHNIFGFRADINFTDKFSFNTRYNFSDSKASWRGNNGLSLNTVREFDTKSSSLSAKANYIFSPSVVANLQAAFNGNRSAISYNLDNFGGAAVPASTAFADVVQYDIGNRAGLLTNGQTTTNVNGFQTNGDIIWVAGNHHISLGGDIRRLNLDIRPLLRERNVLFSSLDPSGIATRINEIDRIAPGARSFINSSVFGQDDWRINSRFSVTGGLRWDIDLNPDMIAVGSAFPNAATRIPDQVGNFAPRLATAIDLTGRGKAVLRAGVGLFYDFGNSTQAEYVDSYPYATGAYSRNTHFSTVPGNPLNPLALFATDLKTPHTWQFFMGYQQEIFRNSTISATYVAVRGRDLMLSRTFAGVDPNFNVVRLTDSSGSSNYHAFDLTFDRRFANNFMINARYSLSRSIDNVSSGTISNGPFVTDPALDRGPSDFDAHHTVSIIGAYILPAIVSKPSARWWARNWKLSANLHVRSAFPVNITYDQVNDLGVVSYRPDLLTGISPVSTANGPKIIDRGAFSIPPALGQGSLGRNIFRGFPMFQINTALEKRFKLSSEASLKLKIEAFNLLNTVNYENMSGSLGTRFQDGTFLPNYYFGRTITSLGSGSYSPLYLYGGARTVNLSARFDF